MRVFSTIEEIEAAAGEEIGTTDWVEIDQDRVNKFADATGDHQWIHVDVEKRQGGPFGGTIAHGYLTLSLVPWLGSQVFTLETAGRQAELRGQQGALPQPGPGRRAGPRDGLDRRGHRRPGGQAAHREATSIEIEGEDKPACVAETVVLLLS